MSGVRGVWPRNWALWRRRPPVIGYVLVMVLGTCGLTTWSLRTMHPTVVQWRFFALLLGCGVLYTELSRRIERARRQYQRSPYVDLDSVWIFAAVLLLPPGLVGVIIAVVTVQLCCRVRYRVVHQRVFSAASMTLAAYAAAAVLTQLGFDSGSRSLQNFVLIAIAAAIFHGCQFLFVGFAIFLSQPGPARLRAAIAEPLDLILEAATIGLGFLFAWALLDWPVVGLVIIGVTFVLYHVALVRQLRDQARKDPKTGLLNIDAFRELADRELAKASQRNGHHTALLLLDLDHFKSINDTYGHPTGDEVLTAFARTVTAEVRAYDIVARYGGEEFLILLPDTTTGEALSVADRIRRRIRTLDLPIPASHSGSAARLTTSIGIAIAPLHGTTLDHLLHAADAATYRAKHAGRDTTALAHPRTFPVPERS